MPFFRDLSFLKSSTPRRPKQNQPTVTQSDQPEPEPTTSNTQSCDHYAVFSRRLPVSPNPGTVVASIAISPDSATVAIAWTDGEILLYHIVDNHSCHLAWGDRKSLHVWPCMAFSPNGRYISTSDGKRTSCQLWEASTGQPAWKIAGNSVTWSIAFSSDSHTVLWADESIHICHTATGEEIYCLPGHSLGIVGIHHSPSRDLLISTSLDASIRTWTSVRETEPTLHQIRNEAGERINWSAISCEENILACADFLSRIVLWDLESGKWLYRPCEYHSEMITGLDFSPDGRHLASTSSKASEGIHILEVTSGQRVSVIDGFCGRVVYSPNGLYLCALNVKDNAPCILDLTSPPKPNSQGSSSGSSGIDTRECGVQTDEKVDEDEDLPAYHNSREMKLCRSS